MMNKCKHASQEFQDIKKKLSEIQNDLKRFMEQSNRQQLELILASSRKDFSNAIISHVIEDVEDGLDTHMVRRCDMRETCRAKFSEFLKNSAGLLQQEKVGDETIAKNKSELDALRATAPYKKCDICFSEVAALQEKQINLMKALQIYKSTEAKAPNISAIPEESIVDGILDPVSNKTRLQILKALYYEPKTFSALSELTGLRAGNLLFHLQKLLNSGMVIQRHEGGDYMITDKGYKVLTMITYYVNTLQ